MKLSDYMAEFLAKHTAHAFVGHGGCIVHLLDSLNAHPDIKVIPCQNEQGSSMSAEAYARVSGKIGLGIATSGPGMVNLIQGIACAYFDSIPTIFIAGAPPVHHLKGNRKARQIGFQECEVVGIVKPITKYAVLVTDPKRIRYELEKLLHYATEGRKGPVVLDLPDDLQRAEINPEELESFIPDTTIQLDTPKDSDIDQMLSLIREAKKPVVIVGAGVKIGNAVPNMREFLKKSGLPFVGTWSTLDLFVEDEPGFIGSFGVSSTRAGNFAVQNSDLIISLASRLDTHETGSNPAKFAMKAKKIMIDIDPDELNKENGLCLDIAIQSDINAFFEKINSKTIETQDLAEWKERTKKWTERYPVCLPEYYDQVDKVNPYVFMNELSKETKEGDIVIPDAGGNLTWTMQAYKLRSRQMLFSAFNHSPMGYALPAAIGAQFAEPEKQVICIIGDGGLQMNIQELETVSYYNLPIKIFLINNEGYGIIKQTIDTWLDSRYVCTDTNSGLGFPDFKKVAKAYKIETMEIPNQKNLNQKLRIALDFKGPLLIDVRLKSDQKITPKLAFGRPIEDMDPLLPREEFEENMRD
ncbi:MAG: acetolactate synthase [Nitrospinae bacterium CG11_big_fil_rev_8_21_14_0_20_45_15]|nr:MAG: acetolactate synthase [Nitrospinae bacterium CG11_big_fil_rev_8_21_14_0_20_45_15]